MGLDEAKAATGFDFKSIGKEPSPAKIMDLRPSHGLAAGLKRVGGRAGTTRLGRTNRENLGKAKKGRPIILHKF